MEGREFTGSLDKFLFTGDNKSSDDLESGSVVTNEDVLDK